MIDLDGIRKRDAADMEVLPNLEAVSQHVDDEELRGAIHMVRDRNDLLAYVDELREAAGRVRCARCERMGHYADEPCPDCADLRALLQSVDESAASQ